MKAPARFHRPLSVRQLDDERWQLLAMLVFYSAKFDRMITVRKGFVTDFASVPRVPLAYWLFAGVAQAAAVVHDSLYTDGIVPREVADAIFLEALEASGVSAWRRLPMYWAVRAFGGSRYHPAPKPGLEQHPAGELEREAELE